MQCFPLNKWLTEHKRTTRPHYPQQAHVVVLEVSRRLTWSYCFKQDRDLASIKELKNLRVWRNLACSLTTRDNCAIVTDNDLTSTGKFGQLLEARIANKNCRPLNKTKQNFQTSPQLFSSVPILLWRNGSPHPQPLKYHPVTHCEWASWLTTNGHFRHCSNGVQTLGRLALSLKGISNMCVCVRAYVYIYIYIILPSSGGLNQESWLSVIQDLSFSRLHPSLSTNWS